MDKFKVIDLFCGIGGFSYGFNMTEKFDVILGADIWNVALNTFKENHSGTELLNEDLTKLPDEYWEKYKDKVDVIIAGPPCQGFSMIGQRKKDDKRNSLFEEVLRAARITSPKIVIIENVVGLLSMTTQDGKDIKELIIEEFEKLGYSAKYKVLNAADYGVPQQRKRVIFIMTKPGYNVEYPEPIYKEEDYITVGEAIGNVDPNGDEYLEPASDFQKQMSGRKDICNHVRRESNALVTKRMSFIPQGGNWQDIPKELGTGGGTYSNAYKRLDPKKPSVTIKHAAKAMIIHPTENRILTVRECARLQSFNDDFVLTGNNSDQHQQLANAVPPLLGKAIAEEIYKGLTEKNEDSKLNFIDLFCGMGGFRIAFERNDCKCVFSSDIDLFAQKTYVDNFNEIPFGDITAIDAIDIPDHDIICAGFPCQAFSIAGKRLGFNDTRGTLFFDVARIIKEKRPKAFILENVKGITNHDGGKTLQIILNTLTELGYDFKYKVLNAKDYNVPQHRERWYCVGFRKDLNIDINSYNFPEPQELTNKLESLIETSADEVYNISDTCYGHINKFIKIKSIDVRNDTLAYEVRASRCQFKNDGISPCLTAKMGTGGNNVPIIVQQKRRLTERECLRIMGYPENYKIKKGAQTYKQIGNSVVVPIITLLANEIVRILKKKED